MCYNYAIITKNKEMETLNADREKALHSALAQIEKKYGKGSVMALGDNEKMSVSAISTGSLTLDIALGVGGLPRGRIVEIYGPEAAGKSLIAQSVVSQVQKNGGVAAYIDVEHALDPSFAKKLGVDVASLLVSQPDSGEQALDIAEMLIRSGTIDVVVIDSVAALVPQAEINGEMGDAHVGLVARLMSQALRKLTSAIASTNCVCIFINQLREKVGVMYGNPEVTTGGKALKFYASVRLDVRKVDYIKEGAEVIGHRAKVKVVKNKVAPPFRQAEFDIFYDSGISQENEIIDVAVDKEIIRKSGAWFSYNGENIGQGKEKTKDYLKNNPEVFEEIKNKILSAPADEF